MNLCGELSRCDTRAQRHRCRVKWSRDKRATVEPPKPAVEVTEMMSARSGVSALQERDASTDCCATRATGRTLMRDLFPKICFSAAAMLAAGTANANDELIKMSQNPKDWVMPTGNYANHRYSQLNHITSENAARLQVAWTFSTGVLRGHEGGPLVIGNVMYVHGLFPNPVFALDLNDDGKILWKYDPKQDPNAIPVMCCDTVNRGLAYGDGKIFLHQADTTLVALDAKTGKVVWSAKNGDPSKGETGTSAPMVIKDKVFVGISGGEFAVRGSMTAYDIKTGKQAWRAYSVGPDNEMLIDPQKTTELGKPVGRDSSLKSWQGDQWKLGGSTTWGWYSYDPELNLVYYGSANPGTWNPSQRPGDNKWSMTIFARDVDTGVARWVYQMTPHDEWDYDGVNEMILVDQTIGGTPRKLLVHFDRNGFAYTLDRTNGELLVAEKYDPAVNWATRYGQGFADLWTSRCRPEVLHPAGGHECKGDLPGCARNQGSTACGILTWHRPVLRADEPRLHGLRAVQGELHGWATLCRGNPVDVPAARRGPYGQFHCLGRPHRQGRLVEERAILRLVGCVGNRRQRRVLRNA
jgi:PQQ-dependent dehydrogenase (methanol/ethanol family)